MGKRYYCNYCDKFMVASPSIVRTHNKGLVHQKLVTEHYQQFKDIETILAEESGKKPCSRFAESACKFGSMCRFSHYTREQLQHFRECVASKQQSVTHSALATSFQELYKKLQDEKSTKPLESQDGTSLLDHNGVTHMLPWIYNGDFDRWPNLPPSLRRLQIEDFDDVDVAEWG